MPQLTLIAIARHYEESEGRRGNPLLTVIASVAKQSTYPTN